jgi:hypothetical protein
MASPIESHKFNDDLLLDQQSPRTFPVQGSPRLSDRELAGMKYPTILHVLDHAELRELFSEHDVLANRAKRAGQRAGFRAIGLVGIALAIASAEHLLNHEKGTFTFWVRITLIFISAFCGLGGVAIGAMGILFAGKKREWLYRRLMTERIRQWHFQTFVFRVPEILQSLKSENSKKAFARIWKSWFEVFKASFDGKLDEKFTEIIEDERATDIWLHEARRMPIEIQETSDLNPLFDAYRELRIKHQIGYADHKLRDDYRVFSDAPRRQDEVLFAVSFTCIILVCAIHVGVLFAALLQPAFLPVTSVIIIWIAIAALAMRAVEQGLQPERELQRYLQYRSAVQAILERFDNEASQSGKLYIMLEMERLAFDEMRNFLITNQRARFVM